MPGTEFVPLRMLIPWPEDVYPLLEDDSGLSFLDLVGVENSRLGSVEDGLRLSVDLAVVGETGIGIAGIDSLKLVLGSHSEITRLTASLHVGQIVTLSLENVSFRLRFPTFLFKAMRKEGEGFVEQRDENGHLIPFEIRLEQANLVITDMANIEISFPPGADGISLDPFMVGESGITVEANEVLLYLSETADLPAGVVSGTRGIYISNALVHLPESLSGILPDDVTIENFFVGSGGFSGVIRGDWTPVLNAEGTGFDGEGELVGIPFGLRLVALEFQHNIAISSIIRGSLLVPYFDEVVEVGISLLPDGRFGVTLQGADANGITLTKQELLAFHIKSLSVGDEHNVGAVVVSGGLEPLLMSSDGLKWPRLDVKDLYIDTTGKFRIAEAWLDLKELTTLDLWGFHLELNRIGLGYEQGQTSPADDRLWIDLSGSLRLIEQIPVGLGVEGFRLKWPPNVLQDIGVTGVPSLGQAVEIASKIDVEFAGIYLFFGVPEAVEFEGLIRFFKNGQVVGFAGDMALRVPASGFAAEAGLLVGMNLESPPLGPYPFLYVYFGVELPAGIPLGQSGLALKGAQGMFGLNVVPDKAPEENWYYDWYKRGPIVGAHPTNKWTNARDALALGVGVTITTADGYVKGTRGLLVLSIPGPVLIIEGRALILDGLQPTAEPPLRALAVFDGIAGTAQFNIEAEATLIEDMLEAYGALEAFFDFNDLTNWHLYLGQDEPRDRRIRASVLKFKDAFLFKADAYLMMDMVGAGTLRSRMGVFIGFNPPIPDIGPLEIEFDATLEGDGVVTARPDQFSGDVGMSANIGLSAFGFGVQLAASADVLTEGPKPFKVDANVHVEADLPWPLDPVEADLQFVWQSLAVLPVESPLSEITVDSRFLPSRGGFRRDADKEEYKIRDASLALPSQWEGLAKNSPPVPVDSQPIIAFNHEMNHEEDAEFFARHPDGDPKYYDLGIIRLMPTLTTVELYEHGKENTTWNGDDTDWTLIASSDASENKPLPGVWLTESDPQSPDAPSARRAQLWTDNPLAHTGSALGAGYSQFQGSIKGGKPLAERVLEDYPGLMKCEYTEAKRVCVDFRGAGDIVIEPGTEWERMGLSFSAGLGHPARVQSVTEILSVSRPSLGSIQESPNGNWLAVWAARILVFIVSALRRFFPALGALLDRLFGRTVTRTCLFVDGYLDICFPQSVRKVWINLCQPPKFSLSEVRPRIRVRRAARTPTELAKLRNEALLGDTTLDLRACAFDAPFDLAAYSDGWLLEADKGFDCVEFIRMGEFAIKEVCYVTAAEKERAERAKRQCETNANPPEDGQTLRAGAYYRLDVTTSVLGHLNLEELPFASDSFLGDMLVTAYTEVMSSLGFGDDGPPKNFHQVIFFQTESPPSNLRPYVKWSSPLHQADRVFCEDDIAIRFLRSNVGQMFRDPYKLGIRILDAQGKLVQGYTTDWLKAQSATLFAEEEVWQEHRSTLDWPPAPVRNDDILLAEFDWGSVAKNLLPGARYEVQVVRTDDRPKPDDKPLYSTTFTTSKFASFEALVRFDSARAVSIAANDDYQAGVATISGLQASAGASARAEWEWQRAQVDYRFEMLKGGRDALEQARLKRRHARATHDANFRALAEALADLYFHPLSEGLEVYLVRDANTDGIVCVWIRSPESLDLRMDVPEDPNDEVGNLPDYVGRTEVRLQRQGSTVPSPKFMLHNADSTQVLLVPPSNTSWVSGPHRLEFTYHRDYGDEARSIDHRYDRPREFRHGSSDPEEHTVEFVL